MDRERLRHIGALVAATLVTTVKVAWRTTMRLADYLHIALFVVYTVALILAPLTIVIKWGEGEDSADE